MILEIKMICKKSPYFIKNLRIISQIARIYKNSQFYKKSPRFMRNLRIILQTSVIYKKLPKLHIS